MWQLAIFTLCMTLQSAAPPEDSSQIFVKAGETKHLTIPHIARIAIGDPAVADVAPEGASAIRITGTANGQTTLLVWTSNGERKAYLVTVGKGGAGKAQEPLPAPEPSVPSKPPPERAAKPAAALSNANCADRPLSPKAAQIFDIGMSLIAEKKYKDSIATLQQAAALEPNLAIVHMYLGTSYAREGDMKAGAREYEIFAKSCPNHLMAPRVQALLKDYYDSQPHK